MSASGTSFPNETATIRRLKSEAIRKPTANTFKNLGDAYYNQKNYEAAIACCTQAIELNAEDSNIYNTLGAAYCALMNYDEAIAHLNQAIVLDPMNSAAYHNRGYVYFDLRDYEKALADFSRYIELVPRSSMTHNVRGRIHQALGNEDLAIADFKLAIQFDENNVYPVYNIHFFHHTKEMIEEEIMLIRELITSKQFDGSSYSKTKLKCLVNRIAFLPAMEQEPLLQACLTAITEETMSNVARDQVQETAREIINQLRYLTISKNETVEPIYDSPVALTEDETLESILDSFVEIAEEETVGSSHDSSVALGEGETVERVSDLSPSSSQPSRKRTCILSFLKPNSALEKQLGDDFTPASLCTRRQPK